jgi:hypothetical protein
VDLPLPDCPSCGDRYELGASFCSYCGYALSSKAPLPEEAYGVVGKCACENRSLNKEGARFCRFCGNTLFVTKPASNILDAWHSTLALEKDETVISSWEAEQKEIRSMLYGDIEVFDKGEGLLVLTDQTLMWLHRLPSEYYSEYSRGFRIQLDRIKDISTGLKPISHMAITDDEGVHVVCPFSQSRPAPGFKGLTHHKDYMNVEELSNLQKTLMKHRDERKFAILEAQKRERVQVIVDFSFLKDYMQKGGMVVQKISCANCGASMHLPERGNAVDCPYCKTTYQVQDVFERIKQLIG